MLQACLPAALLALEDVNNNQDILTNYHINLAAKDDEVIKSTLSLRSLITIIVSVRQWTGGLQTVRAHLPGERPESGRQLVVQCFCDNDINPLIGRSSSYPAVPLSAQL